ncbi:hypothetical protein QCA50_019962 [Cerrena zonata]|uniref:Uncharacterized protein n=1 Tax=Cerrena zonata TaxID=2478898 RepID=A0AAW0FG13_9APHY
MCPLTHFDVHSASNVQEPSSLPNPSVCMSGSGTMTPTPSVAFVHWSSSYHTVALSTYCTRNIVTPSSLISPIH